MKICFVCNISEKDVFGLDFVKYFSKKDRVSIITYAGYNPKSIPSQVENIYTIEPKIKPGFRRKMMFFKLIKLTREYLKMIKPDLVLGFNAGFHAGIMVETKYHPFLLLPYGSDISYGAFLLNIDNILCKYIVRKSDFILAQDRIMYNRLRSLGVHSDRIILKHWGVDTSFFYPNKKEKIYDIINIFGYNNIFYRYVNIFLESLAILKSRKVNCKVLFLGNDGYFDKMIDDLDVHSMIVEKGFLDKKGLRECFWRSKIFVDTMYPKYDDGCGFGIGLLQAMSCGVPIISADRESMLLSGEDKWFYGDIFKHCNPISLADRIEYLLGNKKIRDDISKLNMLSVKKNFDRDKNMDFVKDEIKRKVVSRF